MELVQWLLIAEGTHQFILPVLVVMSMFSTSFLIMVLIQNQKVFILMILQVAAIHLAVEQMDKEAC